MNSEQTPQNDRGRFFVLVLLLITTVFSAVLAGLQADAGIRADQANIQSQYYAVQASGEVFRQGQQAAYDLETFSTYLRFTQENMVLEFSALERETSGDQAGAERLRAQASSAGARALAAKQVSVLFHEPRFAPADAGGLPDLQAYLGSQLVEANALTAKQNIAADDYHRWDEKADSYLTILSLLALVFFLLGVAQNARGLRAFFTGAALFILLGCGLWTFWSLLT